jgi:hypothetical protein
MDVVGVQKKSTGGLASVSHLNQLKRQQVSIWGWGMIAAF